MIGQSDWRCLLPDILGNLIAVSAILLKVLILRFANNCS